MLIDSAQIIGFFVQSPWGHPPPDALTDLRTVVSRARAGDASVVPQLRAVLDDHPALVRHYGDLARQTEAAWITLAAGSNLYLKETVSRAAEAQRAELTRPGAQPVEKLLVERVVACGLQVQYFSATEANALAAGDTCGQLRFHAKRVGQAQRMYLAALGALVTYQKLVPVEVVAVAEHAVASEHEERLPAEMLADPRTRARLTIEDDAVAHEPACEERERVRIRAG